MEDLPGGNGPRPERLDDAQALARAFEAIEEDQFDLNRRAASRAEGIAEALDWARRHPFVYALPHDVAPGRTAERCAVLEASTRLLLSESTVRSLAATADLARARLPLLWSRARQGLASLSQIDAALTQLPRLADDAAAIAAFDRALHELAAQASVAAFRARARQLARRLAPGDDAKAHTAALEARRVEIMAADDGMAWVSAYVPAMKAVAIGRRLTAAAKALPIADRRGRTRDQVRADVLCDDLLGVGAPTAVKTKVFVTVPLDRLAAEARASVRPRRIAGGIDRGTEAQLVGHDAVDDDTAVELLLREGCFTRVVTDPVTGVILDMDRRSRKVTRAQREWLVLHHGHCTRDGCRRPAADADVDHWIGFHSPERGPTDIDNLHPLCDADHALRETRIGFRRRDDLSVQLRFPTGRATRQLLARAPVYGSTPPF